MKNNDKNIKIVLIHCRPQKQARSFSALPLGILYLGTVLKRKGYKNLYLIDHSFEPFEKVIKQINEIKPTFVGLSAMSAYFQSAKKIGKYVKENLSSIVILGGPHASVMSEKDFFKEDWIDFLVKGEGELILPELIENYDTSSQIKGIAYRDFIGIHFTAEADKIQNLDEIFFPDLDLLPTVSLYLDRRRYGLLSSRGCSFRCTFCQPGLSKIWGKRVRYRSPENIIREIKAVKKKYGINDISFLDDTFTLDKIRLNFFLALLRKEHITFDINTRVDYFSEDIARELKKAGCKRVSFGVESGDQKILDEDYKKGVNIEQIRYAFNVCHQIGIESKAYLMLGSIYETPESLRKTEKLIDEIKPDLLSFSITTPFPGTELYKICKEKNLLNLDSDEQLDFRSFLSKNLPIRNTALTYKDIEEWRNNIIKKRRLRFLLRYSLKTLISFIKKPSINFLIRTYKDFRSLDYIG